ncbi:MAG: hypothetical protein WC635_02610 [Bacteriovorax sp.]|jgi:hypothetical protein
MKKLFLLSALALSVNAMAFIDPKVGGTVILAKGLEKNLTSNGVLYVIAKKAGPDSSPGDRTPPVAVVRIEHPKFPQAFVITPKNVMLEGTTLAGPLHVIARYSLSGDALDKKGAIEGFDPKFPSSEIGNKNLNIELKTVLK